MRQFKDNKNRSWLISVNGASVQRVRDLAKIDLLDFTKGGIFERLQTDPITLVNVIYILCHPQAKADGVSEEDFGESMYGDAIGAAIEAITEDIIDFFHDPRQREALRRANQAMKKTQTKALDLIDAKVERMILQMEKVTLAKVEQAMSDPMSSDSCTDSEASSASTLDH